MEDKIKRFEEYLSGLMRNASTVELYISDFLDFLEFVRENHEVEDLFDLSSENIMILAEDVLKSPKYINHENKTRGRLRATINNYFKFIGAKERIKGGYSPSYKNEKIKTDITPLIEEKDRRMKIVNIINTTVKEKEIASIIEEEGFYFQKGQDALKNWIDYPVGDALKKELIQLSKDYRRIQDEASKNKEISDILDVIFEITTYCDTNAKEKNTRNKYDDKRAIAKAYVRMDVWVEKLIGFKFEPDSVSEGSPKNAINYLIDPENNATVLSENHRKLISENLFQKMYEPINFVANLKLFFEQFGCFAKNSANNTHLYSRLIYFLSDIWKDEVVGLVASDSTGWQEKMCKSSTATTTNFFIIWNSKKPSGNETLGCLKKIIEDGRPFNLFYSVNKQVKYIAKVIDFALDQKDLDTKNWDNKNISGYFSNFDKYRDDNKTAKIVFLVEKLDKIEPIPIESFDFYLNRSIFNKKLDKNLLK
jgi:5-methylcytosine-specific restriction protein B